MGVETEEKTGRVIRPVCGVPEEQLDGIQQEMVGLNNKVVPFYQPHISVEEAVVNAFYHRDYQVREPIEITVEPDKISLLSFSDPDRSISQQAIKEAKILRSRRYRNRNLGDFLKALDLSEGWATGIPTIQDELQKNGSPRAVIDTDEERSYFLIDIPCYEDFVPKEDDPENTSRRFLGYIPYWA